MILLMLIKAWIFLPFVGILLPVLSGFQQGTNPQNAETFNNLVYIATSAILVAILTWIQRTFVRTAERVESVEEKSVPKSDYDSLKKLVEDLQTGVAITSIQDQQTKILERLTVISESILVLLSDSKDNQKAIISLIKGHDGTLSSIKEDTATIRSWTAELDDLIESLKVLIESAPASPKIMDALNTVQARMDALHQNVDRVLAKIKTQPLPMTTLSANNVSVSEGND